MRDFANRKWTISRLLKPTRIGDRLAGYFIVASLLFTVTIAFIVIEYESLKYRDQIQAESIHTVEAVKQQLERTLWNVDEESTQVLLAALAQSNAIRGAQLVRPNESILNVGIPKDTPDKTYILTYQDIILGELKVSDNDSYFNPIFQERITMLGISIALFIGVFGWFLQIIVGRLITDHLSSINRQTKQDSPDYHPITLNRKPINDELSELVDALNDAQRKEVDFKKARESFENQLTYQAMNDPLTLLPNRRHTELHIAQAINEFSLSNTSEVLALFFIDLDGFKEVNDSFGHSVGDRVLQTTAKRLKDLLNQAPKGYISRFGGDEFIATIECGSRVEAGKWAEAIINGFRENFAHNDLNLQLSCSIGVAVFPMDGTSSEELLRKADTAMYEAKNSGRSTFAFFEASMMHDVMLKNTIKNKLQIALENNLLNLHYQPLIDLKDNSICGFEALLRWEDKDLGNVRPDLFIPIAEESGLIFEVDKWVFKTATSQAEKWREQFSYPFVMSVNFSPTNFYHRQLLPWIENEFRHTPGLELTEMEVTERLVLNFDKTVLNAIEEMMKCGVSFSIDDFGTGYSSLAYIKKFSHILSKIKIDRLFVNEIINNSSDRALIESIVTLAKSLNINVLAEGVESRRQEEVLVGLKCDYAQGYFYSKPLNVVDTETLIQSWAKRPRIVRHY